MEIGTDCKSAQSAVKRRNKDFNRVLPVCEPDKDIIMKKLKAHPERREGVWDGDDMGIW